MDFTGAGLELGDTVTVASGSYTGVMSVFDGYCADRGGFMLRIDPNDGDISLCINYVNFSETTGAVAGNDVTIALKEKAGSSLAETDLKAASEAFLPDHGMDAKALGQLEVKLASAFRK